MKFKGTVIFFFFLLFPFLLSSIDVWGHLTEDTTWSPDNNPYHVIGDITVEEDVTLTILPGTVIEIQSSPLTSWDDFYQYFYYPNYHQSRLFWVDGNIIAEGTEEAQILFTHDVNDNDYYWGVIYITETADLCKFTYCRFEYSGSMTIQPGNIAKAAITMHNGLGIIRNNYFYTNVSNITAYSHCKTIEIIDNTFTIVQNMGAFAQSFLQEKFSIHSPDPGYKAALVANNKFLRRNECYIGSVDIVFNLFEDHNGALWNCQGTNNIRKFYGNDFINCEIGISNGNASDSFYVSNNEFLDGNYGLDLDGGYALIIENYFEENDIFTSINMSGAFYNNVAHTGFFSIPGYFIIQNNLSYESSIGLEMSWRNIRCDNNLMLYNDYSLNSGGTLVYNDCMIFGNDMLSYNPISDNPIFRNCIIDFPLDPPLVDGGGNIWLDSLNVDSLFVDWQNGDFHLLPGSAAIDAGFDTLGYYYPFDLEYKDRIWDGDGDGIAVIDIGHYEYGAPEFGGIEGQTFDPINGGSVNYVQIKINNDQSAFTFSDSLGYYEYKLPAGIYDVYAERVFYDDVVEYQIEVVEGEFTQLDIPMYEALNIMENQIPPKFFYIYNYPNPFNPTTTITFNLPEPGKVKLEIYNLKGQKVKTFSFPNGSLGTSKGLVVWNGTDDNNKPVSSGIYFAKLKYGKTEASCKMLLLK
ncbi:MAG: T9SS type A sorting domain-containing protein [Candidatus Cloacimonetes bacterium]|nr:T9SS type A sorting domain-containing protein [Candidatus Cloacimonadota bacterium]MCF7814218.1 T9SS type A sorting domain-containing protein [Candidatus Cloacimonadota bacterium]MCF7868123.1 T9SS type A sorting domain-containing protein [Candidatus Cloacimonadota bacterium]MCF7883589.1 T9SS type A sorting domain-containing protein [Candidatus Cloacimonadota bacterium]